MQFCECGCGTPVRENKYKKIRFIPGHNLRGGKWHWKGGETVNQGRKFMRAVNHPKNYHGYVLASRLVAENILGRPLPPKAIIHHVYDSLNDKTIVICQDQQYHMLLHQRARALRACGKPHWRKCNYCHQYDDPINLHIGNPSYHKECRRQREIDRKP